MSLISYNVKCFIFIPFILISILAPVFSYSQTWLWAKSATTTGGASESFSVSADAGGNVFVTGYFTSPTITFGSTTLTNTSGSDVFIAKYDPTGNLLWAKSAAGTGGGVGNSVNTDASGNAYIIGCFFSPTIIFGSTTLTNAGSLDVFIAKYDPAGNVLWAKSAAGTSFEMGYSVSTDPGGNVFVTGNFGSPTITFGSTTLTNAGVSDVFIAKYDSAGNVLWAKSAAGTGGDYGNSVSADPGGNVFVTGYFDSPTITFGSTTITNTNTDYDLFIAKYDSAGNVLWAESAVGTGDDRSYSVSADPGGNVFVTGFFGSPTITFGSTTLTNASGGWDVFIAKYDPTGNVLWAKSAAGTGGGIGNSVSADPGGNVFVTGSFYSPGITFGSITLTPPVGYWDPTFIVKYDAAGNVLCAAALAGGSEDGNGVSADPFGNAYIGGDFGSSPFVVGSDTLTNTGTEDIYVAKYTCSSILTASASLQNVSCIGNCDGTATANFFGGSSPYTYLWSNFQTTQTITGLCAGIYSFTVTDALDSSATATLIITEPTVLSANISAPSNVSCNALCNGSATATALGGTPAYTFLWNSAAAGQTTPTATGLCVGNYTVTVTDSKGCTTTHTVTITEPTAIVASITPPTHVSCKGLCNGSATVTVSGGTPGYTFEWNTVPLQTTANANSLCAGNYTVTVTDAKGCTGSDTVTIITLHSTPTASFTYDPATPTIVDVISFYDQSKNNIVSWNWLFGDNNNSTSVLQNPSTTYPDTGTYNVQLIVSDINGCIDTVVQPIHINAYYLFYVPNSFTPNGDNSNDLFKVHSLIISEFKMVIYDRWGNQIFETNDINNGWDGKYKNKDVQEDVYVYSISTIDFKKEQHQYIGRVTVIR